MSVKKVVAVSCSHGLHADPTAVEAVLAFCRKFKPDIRIHLGDAVDLQAFMASKVGSGDGDPVAPDIDGGLDFLDKFGANVWLYGNHEDRLNRLAGSRNAIVSGFALELLKAMGDFAAKRRITVLPYSGNRQGYYLGNVRFMHGTVFNEMAVRDSAEAFAPPHGVVVCGHSHRYGLAVGRRGDAPIGINVGTLTRMGAFDYAKARRATLSWGQAFAWGWVGEKTSQLYLCQRQNPEQPWLLPPV